LVGVGAGGSCLAATAVVHGRLLAFDEPKEKIGSAVFHLDQRTDDAQ
jgi:hypothetical protein